MTRFKPAGYIFSVAPIAGMLLAALLLQSALAQTPFNLAPGEAGDTVSSISCAPSNNGTGHLVCAEYVNTGTGLINGVSWLAPPTAPTPPDPLPTPEAKSEGSPLAGAPSCAPRNSASGAVICLGRSPATSVIGRSFTTVTTKIFGIAFTPAPPTPVTPVVMQLGSFSQTFPNNQVGGPQLVDPSCVTKANGSEVICALDFNGSLFGIKFDPINGTSTRAALSSITTPVFAFPACTSAPDGTDNGAALCIVGDAAGQLGFSFDLNGNMGSIQLTGAPNSIGDYSCGSPNDGTGAAICAAVNTNTVSGVAFTLGATSQTGFVNVGAASPDGSIWVSVSCANPNDSSVGPHGNKVACALLSASRNVYAVKFDPRTKASSGVFGKAGTGAAFATGVTSMSCIRINIDQNQITCGATLSGGGSGGFIVPIPIG
jgi:hypothetical protein